MASEIAAANRDEYRQGSRIGTPGHPYQNIASDSITTGRMLRRCDTLEGFIHRLRFRVRLSFAEFMFTQFSAV